MALTTAKATTLGASPVMPNSQRSCITIPLDRAGAAWLLWAIAVVVLTVDMFVGSDVLAMWALLAGMGAGTTTVSASIDRAHRLQMEILAWEHARTREATSVTSERPRLSGI